jgi:hypothetical protein
MRNHIFMSYLGTGLPYRVALQQNILFFVGHFFVALYSLYDVCGASKYHKHVSGSPVDDPRVPLRLDDEPIVRFVAAFLCTSLRAAVVEGTLGLKRKQRDS